MATRSILITVTACIVSFAAGFLLANSLNRSDIATRQSDLNPAPTGQSVAGASGDGADFSLTSEEIEAKLAAADNNPSNFAFQKNLGLSLYRYAALKQDASVLPGALRVMERALALRPDDRDLMIGIGNAYFDKGYLNKNNDGLGTARDYYNRVLDKTPGDADVRTDLALTYFLRDPPDLSSAVAEFETALASDPKHERALQFLARTYLKQNDSAKAAATLEKLKQIDPSSAAVTELSPLIASMPK